MPRRAEPGAGASDQRDVRVKRALSNPAYFAEVYYAPSDPNWVEIMPPFAIDMLRFAVGTQGWPERAGVVMLPPEFLKSSLLSQVYPLWLTVRARVMGKLLRGMLLSEEEGMAAGNLSVVAWHILNNERLASDFVDGQGRRLLIPDPDANIWNETALVIHRPGMVSRDPTWQAKGLESKGIQGRRLDVVIGDDIVTPRNSDSPAHRKAALKIMDETVETRVVAGGQILVAGNYNSDKDLLSTLAARPRYELFKRPSLHRPGQPSVAPKESEVRDPEKAVLTWPQNWTRRRLMLEQRDKPMKFRRIHLLDPRAEQGDRLQVGWVTLISEEMGAALLKYARFFIGVDPAPGGDELEDLDFFNVTVVALTSNHCDVVQSFNVRADTPRQVDLLGAIHDAHQSVGHGVVAIGGAKVSLDRYFRGAVNVKRPDLAHKMVEISIPQSERGKETRLEGLGPRAQSGWLRVWDQVWDQRTSDTKDQPQETTLFEEWREFPYSNHDDSLDGLDIAIRTAEEFALVGDVSWEMSVAEA